MVGDLLISGSGTSVIGIRIDGDAPSWSKDSCNFYVFRIHQMASGKKITSFGQIYISLPSKMDMQYDQPEGNRFLINGDIMCQKCGCHCQ